MTLLKLSHLWTLNMELLGKIQTCQQTNSAVDPFTAGLDPDPGFEKNIKYSAWPSTFSHTT